MSNKRVFQVEIELTDTEFGDSDQVKNGLALEIVRNIQGNGRLYKTVKIKDATGKELITEYGKEVNSDGSKGNGKEHR